MEQTARLAAVISEGMKAQGLTFQTLANRAALKKSTIHRWLNGDHRKITVDALDRIADALDTTMEDLVAAASDEPQAAA